MIRIFLLIIVTTVLSCNTSKKAEKEAITINSETKEPLTSFTVSFISIGAGTDYTARSSFNDFISSFEQANNIKLMYETINWGREGETDYCFDLKTFYPSLQDKFITESKEHLASSTLIRYIENKDCKTGR